MPELITPSISSTSNKDVQAILLAAESLSGDVRLRKEQTTVLLSNCHELVAHNQAHAQHNITRGYESTATSELDYLKSACDAVKGVLDTLTQKGFLWCLVNTRKIDNQVQTTQAKIQEVYQAFQLDGTKFQSDLEVAQKKDREDLSQYLLDLSRDNKRLLDAVEDHDGVHRRREELEVNIIKYVEHIPIREDLTPEDRFLQVAGHVLYQLSNRKSDLKFPQYILSSLDVEHYDNEQIGRGASGQVYLGRWQGTSVAIKRMHPSDAKTISPDMRRRLQHEVSLWATLRHDNILPLYGACLDANVPFLVMKYCPDGDVQHYLQKNPSADRFRLSCDVAVGLAFLHSKSIVHADVKGKNVLVSGEHRALLTDFGLSTVMNDIQSQSTISKELGDKARGTMAWMAPEVHTGSQPDMSSDVYSLGMTIWEIYSDQPPFSGIRLEVLSNVVANGTRPDRPTRLSNNKVWDVVQRCWLNVAKFRPTADHVVDLLNSSSSDGNTNIISNVRELDKVLLAPRLSVTNWNSSVTMSDSITMPWSPKGSTLDPKDQIWTDIIQALPPQWEHVPWGGRMYVNSTTIPFVPTDKQYEYRVFKGNTDLEIRKTYERNADGSQTINFLEYNRGYGIIDTTHIKVFAVDSENEKGVLAVEWNPANKPLANVESRYAKEVRAAGVSWMIAHSKITYVTLKRVLDDKDYEFRIVSGNVDLGVRRWPVVGKTLTINLLEYNNGQGISAQYPTKVLVVDPDIGGMGTLVAARWPSPDTDQDIPLPQSPEPVRTAGTEGLTNATSPSPISPAPSSHQPATSSPLPVSAAPSSHQPAISPPLPVVATPPSHQPATSSLSPDFATPPSHQPAISPPLPVVATPPSHQPATSSLSPDFATPPSRQPAASSPIDTPLPSNKSSPSPSYRRRRFLCFSFRRTTTPDPKKS